MKMNDLFQNFKPLRSVTNMVVDVSPEAAKEYLEKCNIRNRPLSAARVEKFASQMKAGKWRENTNEPIGFTHAGVLVDGQHRLAAVVKAGVTVRMTININAEEDDFKVLNTGKSRTVGDVLGILGIPSFHDAAAIIGYYMLIRDKGLMYHRRGTAYTHEEHYEEYMSSPELWNQIVRFSRNNSKSGLMTCKMIGAFYGTLSKGNHISSELIERFFREANTGNSKCKAVEQLNTRLSNDLLSTKVKMTDDQKVRLIVKAANLFFAGKNDRELFVRANDIVEFK